MKTPRWLCLGVLLWASACTAGPTTPKDTSAVTVVVHVTRLADAWPIANALMTTVTDGRAPSTVQARTETQGTATLVVPPGDVIVSADHPAYNYEGRDLGPLTVGQIVSVNFILEPKWIPHSSDSLSACNSAAAPSRIKTSGNAFGPTTMLNNSTIPARTASISFRGKSGTTLFGSTIVGRSRWP
jgi:hypothetical protein